MTTVIEEYAPAAEPQSGVWHIEADPDAPSGILHVPIPLRGPPVLIKKTTTVVGPVHTVATARVAEREVAQATMVATATAQSATRPAGGCLFGLGALVPIAIIAAAAAVWRFRPWK